MKQEIDSAIKEIINEYYKKGLHLDYFEIVKEILKRKPDVLPSQIVSVISSISKHENGLYLVPDFLLDIFINIASNISAKTICDPWAGLGVLISKIGESTSAKDLIAITHNQNEFEIGKIIAKKVKWHNGSSIKLLEELPYSYDVFASILPFGGKYSKTVKVESSNGKAIELKNDLGYLILTLASLRLNQDGMGIFVVPNSFFFSLNSPRQFFDELGIGIEAVMSLPAGTFAPYTNIQTSIIVVRKKSFQKIFVAQLTNETRTNSETLLNYRNQIDTGNLETGKYTDSKSFKDINSLRLVDGVNEISKVVGTPAIRLGDLARSIILGKFGKDNVFTNEENSVFIPLIGNSEIVTSQDEFTIKPQNYAQIVIDSSKSNALFVAKFLNSELGKNIRESGKTGNIIPKFNLQKLRDLFVLIPDIHTQKNLLEIEALITKEENNIASLQNELRELRQELWKNPNGAKEINQKILNFSERFTVNLQHHAIENLESWFETLPFPMASILRSWQATQSEDFKTKYEHLLHFFEGTSEFLSIILLSAFSNNDSIFEENKKKIIETLKKQNLSFQRPTFGTWKTIVEFLGKQTRQMLIGDEDKRAICANLFEDNSFILPKILANKEVAIILAETNKMRNDWSGHGGVVGQVEAKLRNEQLLSKLEKMKGAVGDAWSEINLVQCLHCRPRKGTFENELSILTGSNSEFLKENRLMTSWLDVEQLYIMNKKSGRALQLLPLIRVGSSPNSVKNACYFYNRIERDGVRFVSYHYIDRPEIKDEFEETTKSIKFLGEM